MNENFPDCPVTLNIMKEELKSFNRMNELLETKIKNTLINGKYNILKSFMTRIGVWDEYILEKKYQELHQYVNQYKHRFL